MCIFLRPTMEAKLFLFFVTQPSTKQLFVCVDVRTLSHLHKVLKIHSSPECSRTARWWPTQGRVPPPAATFSATAAPPWTPPSPRCSAWASTIPTGRCLNTALLHCVRYSRYTCHVHSSGIGGGFVMTVFSAERQSAEVLVARERAPAWASEDMYGGDPALSAKVALHAVSNKYLHSIYTVFTYHCHWHSIYNVSILHTVSTQYLISN